MRWVLHILLRSLALLLIACSTVIAVESGYIASAWPSTFAGGVSSTVTVRVVNTGDSDDMIIECYSVPTGWSVSPATRNPYMPSGTYYDATFTVTPPVVGGSGIITWKFYDDDFGIHPFGSDLLFTGAQAVSATYNVPDTTPPTVPVLLSPANNHHTTDATPYLDWSDSTDTESGVQKYEILVETDLLGLDQINRYVYASECQTLSSEVLEAGSQGYFWRVRACDNAGNWSGWTANYKFYVDDPGNSDPYGVGALEPAGVDLFETISVQNRNDLTDLGNLYANGLYFGNRPLNSTDGKLIIAIHGWNGISDARLTDISEAFAAAMDAGQIGAEWRIIMYEWLDDAGTVPFTQSSVTKSAADIDKAVQANPADRETMLWGEEDATRAAERAYQHGLLMGQRILSQVGAANLTDVHLIGHSAGSWAVFGAVRYLNAHAPSTTNLQATLLDPYVPALISYSINPAFSLPKLSSLHSYCRVNDSNAFKAEQYWADDLTALGTDTPLGWTGSQEVVFRTDGFSYGDAYWDGHSGPVQFYADTILEPDHPYASGHGWKHSLANNDIYIPAIIRLTGNLSFGNLEVGTASTLSLGIHNDGGVTMNVSGITYPSGFSGNWIGAIPAGGSRNVTVTFEPMAERGYPGVASVSSDSVAGNWTHPLSGTGIITRSLDSDNDGVCDAYEAIAGTENGNANSYFRVEHISEPVVGGGTQLKWPSTARRKYNILRSTQLNAGFAYLAIGLDATPPLNFYTDYEQQDAAFYKIEVYVEE